MHNDIKMTCDGRVQGVRCRAAVHRAASAPKRVGRAARGDGSGRSGRAVGGDRRQQVGPSVLVAPDGARPALHPPPIRARRLAHRHAPETRLTCT